MVCPRSGRQGLSLSGLAVLQQNADAHLHRSVQLAEQRSIFLIARHQELYDLSAFVEYAPIAHRDEGLATMKVLNHPFVGEQASHVERLEVSSSRNRYAQIALAEDNDRISPHAGRWKETFRLRGGEYAVDKVFHPLASFPRQGAKLYGGHGPDNSKRSPSGA